MSSESEKIQVEQYEILPSPNSSGPSVTLTAELLEKLYLASKSERISNSPQVQFANSGALGFLGFTIADCTFAMVLMGWAGATSASSVVGIFFFTGPILLLLTTIFEWVMGRFLPMMICGYFTVFWLSFAPLQLPSAGIAASYSSSGNAAEGAASVGYNAGIALYLAALGCATFTFLVFALFRTNVIVSSILGGCTTTLFVLCGAYFKVISGDLHMAMHLQKAGGATLFVVGILGWYMTVVMMAGELGFPPLPVGDLSHFWVKAPANTDGSGYPRQVARRNEV